MIDETSGDASTFVGGAGYHRLMRRGCVIALLMLTAAGCLGRRDEDIGGSDGAGGRGGSGTGGRGGTAATAGRDAGPETGGSVGGTATDAGPGSGGSVAGSGGT